MLHQKRKVGSVVVLLVVFMSFVSACGWFSYEDIDGTRTFYNEYDILSGIEDSTLLMSRYPFEKESELNVFIPMSN